VIDNFINSVADIRITHNSMIDDSSIVVFNSSGASFNNFLISYNNVVRPAGSAIFISGGVNNAEISFNRVERVTKNHVSGFGQSGIRLAGVAGSPTNIQRNKSYSNALDGLRAAAGSLNYVIDENHMRFNGGGA